MEACTTKSYTIQRFDKMVDWEVVEALSIDQFPWYKSGDKQETYVKVARTNSHLHIHAMAIDKHSSAKVVKSNGSVYKDSCFEFFVTPKERQGSAYLNFEINCIGTMYLAYNNGSVVREASQEQIWQVKIRTSLTKGQPKIIQNNDDWWSLHIDIPFTLIDELFPHTEKDGAKYSPAWYGNFYRCGGTLDDQYATWNYVGGDRPNFHQPEYFARLEMATLT